MNKLKELRLNSKMTQREFSELLNIKYQQYQRYEYNINKLSIKQ